MTDFRSFRPGQIWPDDRGVHINAHGGGVLIDQGAYYWFGEHKIEGSAGNVAHVGVYCYSSRDLYNWKDDGVALSVSADPASDIQAGCVIERPKVIFNAKTGKYVMWFHLERKGEGYASALVGTAVSDRPAGPYRYIRSFRPDAGHWPANVADDLKRPLTRDELAELEKARFTGGPSSTMPSADIIFRRDFAGGQMSRDMTLFVDDDQRAYHVCASEENNLLHISQLTDDYLESSGRYIRIFPGRFHEAPAMFKHKGRYFIISSGCTGWAPNAARSASADSIWGPWTELGNPCVGQDAQITFEGQSTFVLAVPDRPDAFIFLADRWRPKNAIDGRYLWLPVQFKDGKPVIEWLEEWDRSFFASAAKGCS